MPEINNAFYQELGNAWWTADDHMITFLRAESAIRVDYILKHLPVSEGPLDILDLGAGGGLITIPMTRQGHHVTALDLSDASLSVLKAKAMEDRVEDRVTLLQADMTRPWPLAKNRKYDAILAMDILEHVDDPAGVVSQSSRFLKPGGRFIYHTLNQTLICWLVYLQLAPLVIRNSPKNIHVYSHNIKPKAIMQWLTKAGFTPHGQVGIRPALHPHILWQLLVQRRLASELVFDYCEDLSLGYMGWAEYAGGPVPTSAAIGL